MFSPEIQVEQLEISENVRHLGTDIPTRLIYWHCKVTIRELLGHSKWATGALRRKNSDHERDTCGSCKVTMKSLHELEGKWDVCTWAKQGHGNSRLKYPKRQTKNMYLPILFDHENDYLFTVIFFNLHTSLSEICIINPKVKDISLVFIKAYAQAICPYLLPYMTDKKFISGQVRLTRIWDEDGKQRNMSVQPHRKLTQHSPACWLKQDGLDAEDSAGLSWLLLFAQDYTD